MILMTSRTQIKLSEFVYIRAINLERFPDDYV